MTFNIQKFNYVKKTRINVKIGFVITMYDEINTVQNTVNILNQNKCTIIVIQSDPNQSSKLLDKDNVDFYQKLPDLAGTKEEYLKERDLKSGATTIPSKAVTRNYSAGFTAAQNFDVDWWIGITGDVSISNLNGIKKIITNMIHDKKSVGISRAVGQVFWEPNQELTRVQKDDTTDFMPQFFIVKSDLIKKKMFSKIKITNLYTCEQCLGDEVIRYCTEDNTKFENITFIICDYAYPQFISGLQFNPDRINMPKYIDGFVNMLRRMKTKHSK